MNLKKLSWVSALIFSTAYLWQGTWHELGHATAAVLLHAQSVVLYHNAVRYDPSQIDMSSRIIIAASGILFSLVSGIVGQLWLARTRKRGPVFLFVLYGSVFGYINIGGYLMMSPLFPGGDTGFICAALELPLWLVIAIAIAGGTAVYFQLRTLAHYFAECATYEIANNAEQRDSFIAHLVWKPLLYGIAITTLFELPVEVLLSLLYPLCSPFSILWIYDLMLKQPVLEQNCATEIDSLQHLSPMWIFLMVCTALAERFLVWGLPLN